MPPRSTKIDPKEMTAAKPLVTSMVKKDLKQIKDYALALNKVLKDPGIAAIRICECCVQVS